MTLIDRSVILESFFTRLWLPISSPATAVCPLEFSPFYTVMVLTRIGLLDIGSSPYEIYIALSISSATSSFSSDSTNLKSLPPAASESNVSFSSLRFDAELYNGCKSMRAESSLWQTSIVSALALSMSVWSIMRSPD